MYFKNEEKTKIKKMTALVLALLVIFSLFGCNSKTQSELSSSDIPKTQLQTTKNDDIKTQPETSTTNNLMEEFKEKSPMLDEVYEYISENGSLYPEQENSNWQNIFSKAEEDLQNGKLSFPFTFQEFIPAYNKSAKEINVEEILDTPKINKDQDDSNFVYTADCPLKAGKNVNLTIHKETDKILIVVLQAESKDALEGMIRNTVDVLGESDSFDAIMKKLKFYQSEQEPSDAGLCMSLKTIYIYSAEENLYSCVFIPSGMNVK